MVDLCREIVLRRDGLSREGKYARVSRFSRTRRKGAQQGSVRQWVKRLEKTRSLRVHCNGRRRAAIGRGAEMSIPYCLGRHGIHLSESLRLTQTFVIGEEECPIFHDGSA